MVAWCTQNAPRQQQFHLAPAMSALSVHHFRGYSKTHCKKLVTRVESHAGSVSLLKSCITATKEFKICATVMFSRSHTGGSSLIDKYADTAPLPPLTPLPPSLLLPCSVLWPGCHGRRREGGRGVRVGGGGRYLHGILHEWLAFISKKYRNIPSNVRKFTVTSTDSVRTVRTVINWHAQSRPAPSPPTQTTNTEPPCVVQRLRLSRPWS